MILLHYSKRVSHPDCVSTIHLTLRRPPSRSSTQMPRCTKYGNFTWQCKTWHEPSSLDWGRGPHHSGTPFYPVLWNRPNDMRDACEWYPSGSDQYLTNNTICVGIWRLTTYSILKCTSMDVVGHVTFVLLVKVTLIICWQIKVSSGSHKLLAWLLDSYLDAWLRCVFGNWVPIQLYSPEPHLMKILWC